MKYFLCVGNDGATALVAASGGLWARCRLNAIGKFQLWADDWVTHCEEIFVDDVALFECEVI